ncbi:Rz1-like lysis system protein LysC [Acinetobacter schindleri]|uniref:Rz1-like lysis system protein LysC n=1 Tax=Acinetobacter schindleri TaxID=108981 RepID=UPI003D6CB8EE
MLFVARSTTPAPQTQTQSNPLYPVLTRCNKPLLNIQTNEDLIFALETTELARALCAAKVDSIIQIQEQQHEKTR